MKILPGFGRAAEFKVWRNTDDDLAISREDFDGMGSTTFYLTPVQARELFRFWQHCENCPDVLTCETCNVHEIVE